MDAVTITFDVTAVPGQFEFDTCCFTGPLHSIFLINDNSPFPPENHGPSGIGDCTFDKGVITIIPCECGRKGDLNNDGAIDPLDVAYLVNMVYRGLDNFVYPEGWACPYEMGDGNCDEVVDPLDIAFFWNLIYRGRDYMCDPCDFSP
jgi:hypothetical protein